jgi:hypothetical protein
MADSGKVPGDQLHVERLGGFAGFGNPGSHIRSVGDLNRSKLSAADLTAIDALFDRVPSSKDAMPDGFRYKLTRQTPNGPQTVEVPEEHVPQSVRSAVKDQLI